ncbi:Uncharacterized protein BM_BM1523 [Brugia malayi]|uniref:Bm1523, isoform a n=1 Tax=Brugia malayi TaxID=6279 RepID=A0A4E9FQ88_BRUMA|nr:Uncharacterized protein BM_BM1523 [Brugia malayi]VIO99274.1 Uncharacterized protein BM_BM1523 [Brugia malayi]
MDQTSFYQIHNDLNEMYVVLIKRSIEFQQFARSTVEKLPKIYQEIENDVKFKINDTIAAVQDQGLLVGFLLSNCSTVLVLPVEIINMLFVSVISRILGHKLNNDRQTYFGIVNGTGFIFLVIIGYITRQLTKAYLFSTASAVLTSHLIIQIYMRRVMQVK